MRDLEGKLALVTGGAKGVGRVIAEKLAARGAHVLLNFFHSLEASKETCAAIRARGGQVDSLRASVARQDQVQRMFEEISTRYGHLDILVNNAASGAMVPTAQVTEEYYDRALATNVKGALWCSERAVPLMRARSGGIIVNISSLGAQLPVDNYLVVGTSKAALETLTRYLAAEYAPLGIRVNAASAGMLDTEVIRNFPHYEQMRRDIEAMTPVGRIGTAEDLADVVMFLTSEQSRWIIGQVLVADGGLSVARSRPRPAAPAPVPEPAEAPKVEPAPAPVAPVAREAAAPRRRSRPAPARSEDVAVVGMGLVLAGAHSPEGYWKVLMDGPSLFAPVPPDRWKLETFYSADPATEDKGYCLHSAFVTEPVLANDLPPGEHDFTVHWLRRSLADALPGVRRRPEDRHAFIVGYTADGSQFLEESLVVTSTLGRLERLLERRGADAAERRRVLGRAEAALQARYTHGRSSPARFLPHRVGRDAMRGLLPEDTRVLMVDTACSSSVYSVDIGVKGLLMGDHDVAVCGGAMSLAPMNGVLFSKFRGLSPTGEARPLDRKCDGVLFADGAGIVVLKRLERAREDGDHILAVVSAFGASSDGKGKAIYAPSATGQNLALRRAMAHPAYRVEELDWVIAHATGTPAGDKTEFTSLRQSLPAERPIFLSSNKSIIGHTGWAAGVASLIEAILALQHDTIPPQHRFTAPPADFRAEETSLVIPRTAQPWPRRARGARRVAISSFGFGGTNAHMLISDAPPPEAPPTAAPERALSARLAIVAWSAHLPGIESREKVQAWLSGSGAAPEDSFGELYPLPPFERVRMTPRTARTIDRCQLMVLECAHALKAALGDLWEARRQATGVFLGHMGKTEQALRYGDRTYLDDVQQALVGEPALSGLIEELRADVKRRAPASNEDSFPGLMPNVIPARVANFFDLQGPTMALDTGLSSALGALEVATRYLRSREVDVALVGGINGSSGPEATRILHELTGTSAQRPAEGAVLFALMREEDARSAGLPVLALVDDGPEAPEAERSISCGVPSAEIGHSTSYLGAEAAVALLRALLSGAATARVACRDESGQLTSGPLLQLAQAAASLAPPTSQGEPLPASLQDARSYAPGRGALIRRQRLTLLPLPDAPSGPPLPFLPSATLLLTDAPHLLEALGPLPEDLIVLSTTPLSEAPGRHHVREVTESVVDALLKPLRGRLIHVRVLCELSSSAPVEEEQWLHPERLMALHDLLFLGLKHTAEEVRQKQGSCVGLFTRAFVGEAPHPMAGLFAGFFNSALFELKPQRTLVLFTDEADPSRAAREAERASGLKQFTAAAYHRRGERYAMAVVEEDAPVPEEPTPRLDSSSVVVATGGARGIVAEAVKAIARHHRPHLYLIGSNALDRYPPEVFEGTEEAFEKRRSTFIREQVAAQPGRTVKQLNAEFDRMLSARAARRTLEELERLCGPERVHYLACNVLDEAGMARAMDTVLRAHGRIDLLINGAGLDKSQTVEMKSFADFQYIRDLKLRGYLHLKRALRHHPPRMWCNFGSVVSGLGQAGQTDYASGNTLLNTTALYAKARGLDEFTLGWTVWGYAGMITTPYYKTIADVIHKSGLFTLMSTEEGIHHFLRELHLPRHEPITLHLGAPEKRRFLDQADFLRKVMPQLFPEAGQGGSGDFYIDREDLIGPGALRMLRTFDLQRDAYLSHHVVNGHPTLPGTFVPELAVEAAIRLVPDMQAVAVEDIVFHHFLRVYGADRPAAKRIHARLLERDGHRARVEVRILTDVVAPNGAVLQRDKLHFEAKVLLAAERPAAPEWEPWPELGEVPVPDPYHMPAAPVLLTGPFVSTTGTRLHPLGKRATYRPPVPPEDPVFSRFLTPSILIDGLARVAVLGLVEGHIPIAAPASIRRLDLFELGNDANLPQRYERIELYATPRDMRAYTPGAALNRCVAVRPDGKLIVQIQGLVGIIMGYLHPLTGAMLSPREMGARLARRQGGEAESLLTPAGAALGSVARESSP